MTTALENAAVRVVDDLVAAGAAPVYRPEQAGAFPSFSYECSAGADRGRIRQIIDSAKWRAALWPLVLREVARRSEGEHG